MKNYWLPISIASLGAVFYFVNIPLLYTPLIAVLLWLMALGILLKPYVHVVIKIVSIPFDVILFVTGYLKASVVGGLSTLAPKPGSVKKKTIGELLRERGVPSVDKTEERIGTTTIISSADVSDEGNDEIDAFIHYGNQRKG